MSLVPAEIGPNSLFGSIQLHAKTLLQLLNLKLTMKKVPSNKDADGPPKSKASHAPNIGYFGFKLKKVTNGK